MQALVLERKATYPCATLRSAEPLGAHDVRIAIHTVGICGSDVHCYTRRCDWPLCCARTDGAWS